VNNKHSALRFNKQSYKPFFVIFKLLHILDSVNEALFVSLLFPHERLEISGVEIMLRKIGEKLHIKKVHPHKFRRTLATKAIDKGMPIEQVQHLLGHTKIDTTLGYAMVDDTNVKISHKKYLE
jgi:site-specific recombinase XerD